ncbi:MAG: site-2 protease family protein, partial [Clostridia bacterium]|nr:site-2 protease family protein [Clostridia bacterium]
FRIPAMAIENDRLWMPDCKTEAAVSAAGPTANLFLCALLAALRLKTASTINFALFLINALPVMTLDGGSILFCVASDRFGPVFAERICKAVSFAVIIPIIAAGAIIFETTGKNFSLLAVGLFLLFSLFPKRRA